MGVLNNIENKFENYNSRNIKRNLSKIIDKLIETKIEKFSYPKRLNFNTINNQIKEENLNLKRYNNIKFRKRYKLSIIEYFFKSEGVYDIIMLKNNLFIAITKENFIIYSFFFDISIKKCSYTKIPIENYKESKLKIERISNDLFYIFYFLKNELVEDIVFSIYNENLLENNETAKPIFEERSNLFFNYCILSKTKFCILNIHNILTIFEYNSLNQNYQIKEIISILIANNNNSPNVLKKLFAITDDLILISNTNHSIIYSIYEKNIKRNINTLTKYCFTIQNNKIIIVGIPNSYIISLEDYEDINFQDNNQIFLINQNNEKIFFPINSELIYYFDKNLSNLYRIDFIMINNILNPRTTFVVNYIFNDTTLKLRLFISKINSEKQIMCSLITYSDNSYKLYDENFILFNNDLKKRNFMYYFTNINKENFIVYSINNPFHLNDNKIFLLRERNWRNCIYKNSENPEICYYMNDKKNNFLIMCNHIILNIIIFNDYEELNCKTIYFGIENSFKPIQCVELENGLCCAYKNQKIMFIDPLKFNIIFNIDNLTYNYILKIQKFYSNLLILTKFKLMIYNRKNKSIVNYLILKNVIKTELTFNTYERIQILLLKKNKDIAVIIDNNELYLINLIELTLIKNINFEESIIRINKYIQQFEVYSYEIKNNKINQTFIRKNFDTHNPIIWRYISNDKMFVGFFPNKFFLITIVE